MCDRDPSTVETSIAPASITSRGFVFPRTWWRGIRWAYVLAAAAWHLWMNSRELFRTDAIAMRGRSWNSSTSFRPNLRSTRPVHVEGADSSPITRRRSGYTLSRFDRAKKHLFSVGNPTASQCTQSLSPMLMSNTLFSENKFPPSTIDSTRRETEMNRSLCFCWRFWTSTMSSKVKHVADAAAPVVKRDVNKLIYRIRQFLMLVGVRRPFLAEINWFVLLARLHTQSTTWIRMGEEVLIISANRVISIGAWSFRSQPQPLLPGGFAHKLSKNYYFDRDARRQVGQPQVLFSAATDHQLLAGGAAQP